MTEASLIAGVELGGTKCVCLLACGPDNVRDEVRLATTTPEETLAAIRAVLARWRGEHGFAAVGIGSFGPLELDPDSPDHGRIVSTPKPEWSRADVLALSAGLGVPVALDTDVNGAAMAEGLWGAAQGLESWAYVTVGTGVGVGSIVSGQPVRGLGHSEAGHSRAPRLAGDAWPGACAFHGDCVEGLASGAAIRARTGQGAEALAADHPVWEGVVHALAGLCHNLTLTAVPQRILLGGGVMTGQPHLLPRIRTALAVSLGGYGATAGIDPETFVQAPGLGDRAGPQGAIAIGLTALRRQAALSGAPASL